MKRTNFKFKVLAALMGFGVSLAAHAVDAFDPTTNLLTLDVVNLSGTMYYNVAVTVNSYSLVGVAGGAGVIDSFNPATNTLVLGAVALQGVTYNNVTVNIGSYTLRSVASAGTPGTLATNTYTGEMAGYLAQLNTYRTQCGIPALSQNTILDSAAQTIPRISGSVNNSALASSAGYAIPATTGGLNVYYWSNSTNKTLVGQYELQVATMEPGPLLNLMRPYTEIGMVPYAGHAGGIDQRGAYAMFGNPVVRNTTAPVTFPCANTTDVAPYTTGREGGINYSAVPATALSSDAIFGPTGYQGTPIAVFANVGETLALTSASVTLQGGLSVPVTLNFGGRTMYGYEGYVWPQQNLMPSSAYDVVINGTVNGAAFTKSFTFRTGPAIPQYLP